MTDDLQAEVESLDGLTVRELQARYAEVFGEGSRSGNRRWLTRRIAWRLQADAEGNLPERVRERALSLACDSDLRARPPSGWSLRGPSLGASTYAVSKPLAAPPDPRVPVPGTVLTRDYKGVEHRVSVLPHGFEHGGTTYRSLSAVAHAITGSHWNGYNFFGLGKPKDRAGGPA